MKILIDARMYGLENAGIGRYLMNLITELVSLDKKNTYVLLLREKYYKTFHLPGNWKKILADFRHYTLEEQLKLSSVIKREKPDLVHFPHLNIPYFCKCKFVVTIHDLTMQKQGRDATSLSLPAYYLKRLPFLLIAKKAVKEAVKIIVPSQVVKDDIIKYYKIDRDKINVIYEGFEDKFGKSSNINVRQKYKLDYPYFIYVGSAYPHKNLSRVIKASVLLNKKLKQKIIFAIGGSRNVFIERLEQEIKRLNASQIVRFLGFIPDEDLPSLYRDSVAFIYPSLSEGFGLQGLEAIDAGTILLASNIDVFKEIYKDNAVFFNPYDFTSISEAMKETIALERNKRKEIIEKSQKFIKRYSWKKMAVETLKIYENCNSI